MPSMRFFIEVLLYSSCIIFTSNSSSPLIKVFANDCYEANLPSASISTANRTIPWGTPNITFKNGSTCCGSLTEVRSGIDSLDAQLLHLLSKRAAYVREATRFKATYSSIDSPSRDAQVIDEAVKGAPAVRLPQTIARAVFESILKSSVAFEQCVFNQFGSDCE